MSGLGVWRRLLWREFREGWIFACLATLLPAVVIPLAASKLPSAVKPSMAEIVNSGSITMLISAVANIAVLAIAVWGALRGQRRRSPDHSLPVDVRASWVVRFLAPLLVAAGIGALSGVWASATIGWTHVPFLALAWAGIYSGAFASAYLLASAGTIWLGLVVGAAFAFGLTGNLLPNHWGTWTDQVTDIVGAARMCAVVAAGAFAGNALLGLARRNSPSLWLRIGAIGLAVVIPVSFDVIQSQMHPAESDEIISEALPYDLIPSPLQMLSIFRIATDTMKVEFRDPRLDHTFVLKLTYPARALGFTSNTRVYLLQQAKGSSAVSILVWNPMSNALRTVALIPAGRDALTRSGLSWINPSPLMAALHRRGFVSPSGRYVVSVFQTDGGAGQDLWVTDLNRGSNKLVLANTFFGDREAAWPPGRAVISGSGNAVEVDIPARRARTIEIPSTEGG